MKKEQIIKGLEEDNKSDLRELSITTKGYEEFKKIWLKKDTDEIELVCQIELRKQIIEKLNNIQKS